MNRLKGLFIFFLLTCICISAAAAKLRLEVSGTIGGKEPRAIVNGKLMKVGDVVGGAEIIAIDENSVKFKYENMVFFRAVESEDAAPRRDKTAAEQKTKKPSSSWRGKIGSFIAVLKNRFMNGSNGNNAAQDGAHARGARFKKHYNAASKYFSRSTHERNRDKARELCVKALSESNRAIDSVPQCHEGISPADVGISSSDIDRVFKLNTDIAKKIEEMQDVADF